MPIKEESLTLLLERLLEMIGEFQAQTTKANELLREHLQLENPMYWHEAGISQTGYCGPNQTIRYFYHGIGCKVGTKNLLIDWDYGFEGRVDGFDHWRLIQFAEDSTDNFPEFRDSDLLGTVFGEAIKKGLIHQPFLSQQDNLFYLRNGD
jgi:hypothetical protein